MPPSYNPRTGTYARGAAAYGPYGSARAAQAYNPRTGTYAQTRQGSNMYGNWGSSSVQRGDDWAQSAHKTNYATGARTTGVRNDDGGAAVRRSGAAGNTTVARTEGGDIYAGHDGNVYRKNEGGGWEQHGDGGWSTAQRPANAGQLDKDSARSHATAISARPIAAAGKAAARRDRAPAATAAAGLVQEEADVAANPAVSALR